MNEKVEFILYTARFLEPKTISFNPENDSFGELKEPETRRAPKNEDKKYISSFGTAFENYDSENIKLLIENGADIHEANYELEDILKQIDWSKSDALCKAIENNDTEVVGLLLKNGFDIKKLDINTSMRAPIEYGNLPLIKLLIEYGLDVNWGNINFGTLLELCSIQISNDTRFYDMAKFLIDKGADVNIGSPLMASLNNKRGDINDQIAKLLIKNGADVNYTDHKGKSILIDTCGYKMYGNRYELIQLFIDNGANINYKDNNGNTALMMLEISLSDEDKMMKVYEDGTAELDYKADVVLSSEKIMKLLIDNGADINAKNNMGMTPLMKYSMENNHRLVKILLENGADVNAKSEMTAFDLAGSDEIKTLIKDTKNNNPQKLVKLLSNFTIDKPIKYTTHSWDFGDLKKEYGNFDGYMDAVKKQFDSMKSELEELSPNLYKKIYTFLIETNPEENYSWCSKTHINIGWSSLEGLKEHCDSGENPFSFRLPKAISYKVGFKTIKITTFEEVINLFKQEIEIRENFKNLSTLFINQQKKLDESFELDLSTAKLGRQFYTDTQKFSSVLDKIFADMGTRKEYPNITVTTTELEDRSIELKITQIDSNSSRSADELLERVKEAGDMKEIKESLTNLCDWSVESSYDGDNFRVNFLHSNNVKEIVPLESKADGFTHILRFYK
ncbi:MAG: ankyrin repeat domain-containing protein [Campylobacterales bacterium]|nr:ankyrin repeat domain-containing protein [Campylobacterales bacterium]